MIRTCAHCGAHNRVPAARLADRGRCGSCKQGLDPPAEPIDVDAKAFNEIVSGARVPVFVDFWASWCAPCRMAAPEVARAAGAVSGRALVLKVDTESQPDLANEFGVRNIPNFLLFQNGRQIDQRVGVMRHSEIEAFIEQALRS